MKTFAAALFAFVASAEVMTSLDYAYIHYVSTHNKFYSTVEEFNMRKARYQEADAFIKEANARDTTYKAGHNQFSDWTEEEFQKLLGLKDMPKPDIDLDEDIESSEESENRLPASLDWRGCCVTPVKNQGSCGSCWAFSTIAAIESAWMINGHSIQIMSEQELVDCTGEAGNHGCSGGWYFNSYEWLRTHYTMSEASYPYTGMQSVCRYNPYYGITEVSSYGKTKGTKANLKRLAKQPINVAVAAGNNIFMYYRSGIITEQQGCPTSIDHAVAAVGWGEQNGIQYYIVRNSWGPTWGEQGYVRIATGRGYGVCGINQYVYYPTLPKYSAESE